MEGPMRIPFPRPEVQLQFRTEKSPSEVWKTVGVYKLELKSMNYRLSGEDLFFVNFSDANSLGTHRLLIPNLGVSHSFKIAQDIYSNAAYHTCRLLYYQRSGMPNGLRPPFAENRFSRPIDHEYNTAPGGRRIDGGYHWSIKSSELYDGEVICPLNATVCPEGSMADGSGGWFDAGDYSKYTATATAAIWRLLAIVDMFSSIGVSQNDDRNIPESSDGVPDTLNEATWSLRWLLKMQRPDGGVYNKIASEIWESGLPSTSDLGRHACRYFLYRTTHDTATTGAVFAFAARLWSSYNSTLSEIFLERAYLAWTFLEKHQNATPSTGFLNPPGIN
jgi:endoglucanase